MGTTYYWCALALAFVAESAVAGLLMMPGHGLAAAFALHVLSVLGLGCLHFVTPSHERRDLWLLLVLVTGTGPFGVLTAALVSGIRFLQGQREVSPEHWIHALLPDETRDESEKLHERIVFGLDNFSTQNSVEPFLNILTGGTLMQKQVMIAKVTRYFRPQFAPLLLAAVHDTNPAVRVQAATALAKIERDFLRRYMRLEKQIKLTPNDEKLRLEQAYLCDDYAHAGLVEETRRHDMRAQAIQAYAFCIARTQGEQKHALSLRLARLYMRENQPEKADELLQQAMKAGGSTAQAAVLWYMEALFRLKKFDELRDCTMSYAPMLKKLEDERPGLGIVQVMQTWEFANAS